MATSIYVGQTATLAVQLTPYGGSPGPLPGGDTLTAALTWPGDGVVTVSGSVVTFKPTNLGLRSNSVTIHDANGNNPVTVDFAVSNPLPPPPGTLYVDPAAIVVA